MQGTQEQLQEAAERQQQAEEAEQRKHALLRSILTPEASERLHRVTLVKPEQANIVSQQLLQLAQSGKLSEKVSDERLKAMLNSVDSGHSTGPKITFQRKKQVDSDEDDYDDL